MRNALLGLLAATGAALAASDIRIAGIDAWKIVLGLIGVALIVSAGRTPPADKP
jgi:hypothetical protein